MNETKEENSRKRGWRVSKKYVTVEPLKCKKISTSKCGLFVVCKLKVIKKRRRRRRNRLTGYHHRHTNAHHTSIDEFRREALLENEILTTHHSLPRPPAHTYRGKKTYVSENRTHASDSSPLVAVYITSQLINSLAKHTRQATP